MLSLVVPKVLCVRRADTAKVACTTAWKAVSVAISRKKKETKGRKASAEHKSESPVVHRRQWVLTVLAISKYVAFHEARFITTHRAFFHARQCPSPKLFAEPGCAL